MPAAVSGYFVDANLLTLLVVGSVDPHLIARHRRLDDYTADDYEILLIILNEVEQVFVTPNTLTEASNLLRQHREPERSLLMDGLRFLIAESAEIVIASARAAANPSFPALGLADAALLEAASAAAPLLTADLGLYLAAIAEDESGALNFGEFMARRPG